MYVRAKKSLGQHFLKDQKIAERIVESLDTTLAGTVLEIGPGTGVLTQYLVKIEGIEFKAAEIDTESIEFLQKNYPQIGENLLEGDFLKMDLNEIFKGDFSVIGNFPYNISSQIFFKLIDYKEQVPQIVCMLQKEVAERLASPPGNKSYGILSVLLQAWYNIDYLFTVEPGSFIPPPKVKSAVISLKRNSRESLGCDEVLFKKVVKASFNQRRKAVRNSVKQLLDGKTPPDSYLFGQRPEQLSVEEFVELTKLIYQA
ncbi:MAG: 16S rRNA (adenine(1518)-N(6)/adenine(1519)-N(6))-dimethyltransferase RsmA [Bacteroidales bacterium]|jgi:16S rRNA (adenine1518-N6/adenine1519-N6)-dimethyltransferase|nr:16S rRNA (adenine(1518)-N(6)/adenine(1519)-N(6))-dimethyltransferase RsmA [Bacteroidales bacterium]